MFLLALFGTDFLITFRTGAKNKISAVHSDSASIQKVLERGEGQPSEKWKVKMLYDGECPLCMREVNFDTFNLTFSPLSQCSLTLHHKMHVVPIGKIDMMHHLFR